MAEQQIDYAALAAENGGGARAGAPPPAASSGHDFKFLGVNIHVPGEDKPRLDSNVVGWGDQGAGIAPEDALMGGQAVRTIAHAASAGGALAGIKSSVAQASPIIKYELTRSTLTAMGVPEHYASLAALAISGLKKGPPPEVAPTGPHLDRSLPVPAGSLTQQELGERLKFGTGTPPDLSVSKPMIGAGRAPVAPISVDDLQARRIGMPQGLANDINLLAEEKAWNSWVSTEGSKVRLTGYEKLGVPEENLIGTVVKAADGKAVVRVNVNGKPVEVHEPLSNLAPVGDAWKPRGRSFNAGPSVAPASRGASAPVAPVPPAAAAAPAGPQSSSAAASPSVPPSPRMGPDGLLVGRPGGNPDLPDQRALNDAALAQRRAGGPSTPPALPQPPKNVKLNAAETSAFLNLMLQGKTSAEAMEAVMTQRELVARLGTPTPTAAQTRFPKGMRGKS